MKAMTSVLDMRTPPVPLARLVRVELRKMLDTRAGFWLAMTMIIMSALITAFSLIFTPASKLDFGSFFGLMNIPLGLLLPVLAILLVTSEWNQRTAMVTFSLEPRRTRVVLAKFITAVITAIGAVAVALAFGAIGNALANILFGDADGNWNMSIAGVVNAFLLQVIELIEAFGFAMLLMNSAAAIVLYFALPTLWNVLTSVVPWLRDHVQQWADMAMTTLPLQGGSWISGEQWAHLAVSVLIWVVVPNILGIVRLLNSEVK